MTIIIISILILCAIIIMDSIRISKAEEQLKTLQEDFKKQMASNTEMLEVLENLMNEIKVACDTVKTNKNKK